MACAAGHNPTASSVVMVELTHFRQRHGQWLEQTLLHASQLASLSVSPGQAQNLANSVTKGASPAFALALEIAVSGPGPGRQLVESNECHAAEAPRYAPRSSRARFAELWRQSRVARLLVGIDAREGHLL